MFFLLHFMHFVLNVIFKVFFISICDPNYFDYLTWSELSQILYDLGSSYNERRSKTIWLDSYN